MIDHVSIGVRDLGKASAFYRAALGAIGYSLLVERTTTAGFGKAYPEFWLNLRDSGDPAADGVHIALRCARPELVRAFHDAALRAGGADDGAPGPRPEYSTRGHSAFAAFIRDPDGNRIEAVSFIARDGTEDR